MKHVQARVEELARQLQPVLGKRVEGVVNLWLAEDSDGRREVEQWLELEHRRAFGDTPTSLAPPKQEDLPNEGIAVGHIAQAGKRLFPLKIPLTQLNKHVLIAGASGSGKTTLIYHFVQGLLEQGVPFFLYDFNLDYRPLAKLSDKVKVYTIGEETAPLNFNPLAELIQLCQTKSQLKDLSPLFQLADVVCKTFYVGHGVKSILCAALAHAARTWAQQDFAIAHTPSFRTLLAWVREHEPSDMKGLRFKEWKVSTIRSLEALCTGSFGSSLAVTRDRHVSIAALKDECAIFELNLPEDLKRFFVESMMLCMRQHALQAVKATGKGRLRNVMILDEAHNLLKKTEEKIESQLAIALREHRGLGTGYIIADQVPSQLDDSAIANTHTKFFFTLDNARDLRTAGQSLLIEDTDVLSRLPTGTALCRFGTHRAFAVTLDPVDHLKHVPVTDEEIARNAGDSAFSTPESLPISQQSPKQPPTLPGKELHEDERKLLAHILKDPFAGVSRHFKGCGMSTRKGQAAKENLEQRGLVRSHEIHREIPGGGKVVILEITQAGAELLRQLGHDARWPYYRASPEHEYWKEQAARHYAARGYTIAKEAPLPLGGAVDVTATKPNERVAIEVETGKSDALGNIQKALDAGFDKVVSLATSNAAADATEQALQAARDAINLSYAPTNPLSEAIPEPDNSSLSSGKYPFEALPEPINSSYATGEPPNQTSLDPVNSSYAPAEPLSEPHPEPVNSSLLPADAISEADQEPIDSSYAPPKLNGRVKVQTIASLQPTAEEFINRFFQLPGPEKLLVLDVLDFPQATQAEREERLARAGVPPERTQEAILATIQTNVIREQADQLALAPTTKDAFKVLRILRN